MTTEHNTATREDIRALRNEAGAAGDAAMVATCDLALDGNADAVMRCVRVILDARAMADKCAVIKIKMSERGPVSIKDAEWPIIARGARGGTHPRYILVRAHEDGRRIVYGCAPSEGAAGGFLVASAEPQSATVRAIRRVAGIIDDDDVGNATIDDLPGDAL